MKLCHNKPWGKSSPPPSKGLQGREPGKGRGWGRTWGEQRFLIAPLLPLRCPQISLHRGQHDGDAFPDPPLSPGRPVGATELSPRVTLTPEMGWGAMDLTSSPPRGDKVCSALACRAFPGQSKTGTHWETGCVRGMESESPRGIGEVYVGTWSPFLHPHMDL